MMGRKKITKAAQPLPPMSSDEGYGWRRKALKRKKRLHRVKQAVRALKEALRS